jgi:hypothetical protein
VQVGWGAGCFRRSGGSGGKGAASVVLGDLSVRRGARAPISGSRRVRRSCFSEARRGVTLQPARQGDRHPPCTCCYIVFLCESRPVLALRAVQCFFRPLRAFPVAAGWGLELEPAHPSRCPAPPICTVLCPPRMGATLCQSAAAERRALLLAVQTCAVSPRPDRVETGAFAATALHCGHLGGWAVEDRRSTVLTIGEHGRIVVGSTGFRVSAS